MSAGGRPAKRSYALIALATAQFVMVLDQSVMNVSISALTKDFDTTVTTIQAVITLYCLVMAMLMLAGAKIGDIIGRRRAFAVGLVIYGCGSGLTAAVADRGGPGPGVVDPRRDRCRPGAARPGCADRRELRGRARKAAYAVIGGVAGAGIAVGPILGGWATTELTWRVVFVGEVVLVLFILAMTRLVADAPGRRPGSPLRPGRRGAVRVRPGLVVLAVLESSTWGWVQAEEFPGGAVRLLADPVRHRGGRSAAVGLRDLAAPSRGTGTDPLVHLDLVKCRRCGRGWWACSPRT